MNFRLLVWSVALLIAGVIFYLLWVGIFFSDSEWYVKIEQKGGIAQGYYYSLMLYSNGTAIEHIGEEVRVFKVSNKQLTEIESLLYQNDFLFDLESEYWCTQCPYDLPITYVFVYSKGKVKEIKIYFPETLPMEIEQLVVAMESISSKKLI